jgi:hypothetical protein
MKDEPCSSFKKYTITGEIHPTPNKQGWKGEQHHYYFFGPTRLH